MARTAPYSERFEDCISPEPNSGCWLWLGSWSPKTGYGRFRMNSDATMALDLAHRASWRLHRGDIPSGRLVCHKCDNRACVNPDHLFLGTHADNSADASRKGRLRWKGPRDLPKGENHPMARLSKEDVLAIRSSDEKGADLARRFAVSQNNISRIRKNTIWRSL